ncbi:MAG TPA: tetratricopeptide repeat protein [Kofleriaceae bacterium]|nr:tetratricopeptide repeat protein [Kofleriaceae bacterium]
MAAAVAGCGGGAATGARGGTVPPPPRIDSSENSATGKPDAKREVSNDARKDYEAAAQQFAQTDKAHGWNDATCRQSADRFTQVVRSHPELVEAQFMVGLSYHRCNQLQDAEKAYQQAIHMKPNHGASLSNLGEIYYRYGKVDDARKYWDSAVKANGKLTGARINIASLELEQMRKINNPKDATWKKLEEDARFNLSNVLGVDSDNIAAYTVYGLVYMEGWQANKNRLDLAKLLLDEAKKRNEKNASLQNAYGLFYLHKASLNQALQAFSAAVEADPKFVEARVNVGLITLNFRKYDTAKEMLSKVVELSPKNYDAYIGLGIALRGLKDLDGAEAQYKKAKDLDPRRGDAYYNLGVLYKDFRASKNADIGASIGTYKQAKDFFQQFLSMQAEQADKVEAKEQIALIDKTVTQIQNFMKAQANQPPAPAAPSAPAAPASPAAPAGGTPPAAPPAGAPGGVK